MINRLHNSGAGRGVQVLRDHNRSLVLRWLRRSGGMARSDIAQRIGLTDAAISRIVRDLIDAGVVREGEPIMSPSRPGRRQISLGFEPRAAFVAAVRLTVFDHGVSLVDLRGERQANVDLPDALSANAQTLPGMIAEAFYNAVDLSGMPASRVLGAGVVTVGAVDTAAGRIRLSSLPALQDILLGPQLEEKLKIPIRVYTAGDALNMSEGILAEERAFALGAEVVASPGPVLLVHIAFGIGANVTDPGRSYFAHQDERLIGHIPVPGATETCMCGARGCLLTRASGHAVMRTLLKREQGFAAPEELGEFDPALLRQAVARANAGDGDAVAAFYTAGLELGSALFSGMALNHPARVVLAGIVAHARPYAKGVIEGVGAAWERVGQRAPEVMVSALDYGRAAELCSLDEFLLREPLDTQRLRAA